MFRLIVTLYATSTNVGRCARLGVWRSWVQVPSPRPFESRPALACENAGIPTPVYLFTGAKFGATVPRAPRVARSRATGPRYQPLSGVTSDYLRFYSMEVSTGVRTAQHAERRCSRRHFAIRIPSGQKALTSASPSGSVNGVVHPRRAGVIVK